MARITYPARETIPADLRRMLDEIPRHTLTDMLAHSPLVARRFLHLAQAQFTSLELSPRHRELLILTVAAHERCEYEYVQHIPVSEAAGVDLALREAIWRGDVAPASLADEDRALLAFVSAVLESPDAGAPALADVKRHFSDREIVEILQLVGFYWGIARLCTVLDLEIDTPDGLSSVEAVSSLSGRE
jgi:alkylhydroperoxidase family enzyme